MFKILRGRAQNNGIESEPSVDRLPEYTDPLLPDGLDHAALLASMGISMSFGILRNTIQTIAEASRPLVLQKLGLLASTGADEVVLLEQAQHIIAMHTEELGTIVANSALRVRSAIRVASLLRQLQPQQIHRDSILCLAQVTSWAHRTRKPDRV